MEKICVDKTASRGIAIAGVLKYAEPDLTPRPDAVSEDMKEIEIQKYIAAKAAVTEELETLSSQNEIFAAHLEIAGDPAFQDSVEGKIREERKNAQMSVYDTVEEFAALFDAMDDAYMKERAADVRDIGKRFMAKLKNITLPDLGNIRTEKIIVAKDLYPSDTVKIDPQFIKGILTEEGGITSHVSILAKSMNIPILVGVSGIMDKVEENMTVCMDAGKGVVVINPDENVLTEYRDIKEVYEKESERLKSLRGKPAVTKDGRRILLCANVGNTEDIKNALSWNIDGIGLFRSEFLYMENTHFPNEEEQFEAYKEAAQLIPRELTIRTLDIGGDKALSYFECDKEENPFLGWRGIRISLDMKDVFKTQLRAILRASAFGHIRIMFPMIISLRELRQAKKITQECMDELTLEHIPYDENIEMGMMMETPASVLLAEEFAKEADFFSIGTNDLTQYLLAIDRGNKKISDRYDYFHPAVVKAIKHIIYAGHKEGIKVGMCGEMAGNPDAVNLLLECGLDEFSMSVSNIDYVREKILAYSYQDTENAAKPV